MAQPGTITFVPSVHFSSTHRRRVRDTIRERTPDLVAVELDERRFEAFERNARLDPAELSRALPPATAATYNTLRLLQRTVARLYGLDPGKTDMETAIETAADLGIDVALIDDPIADTVADISSRVSLATLPKLLARAQLSTPAERLSQLALWTTPLADVESGDDVQPAVDQLRRLLPEVTDVLIDRRDRAMARRLHRLRREGYDVVAVVGAGHHNGILAALDDLEARDATPDATVPICSPSREWTTIPIR